ncbi:hypothetical protein ACWD1Z_03105 [Streptomyces sp. NPDC002784]
MDRYVHHELRSVGTASATVAVCVPVTAGVHGAPLDAGGLGLFAAALLGFAVLCTLAQASRIRWLSEVLDFEAAEPLATPPAAAPLLRHPVNWWLFTVMTAGTLGAALAWEPVAAVFPLWPAAAWLGQAWLADGWERRHGKVLWRGHDPDRPGRLAVSPRPLPRTATGAPPE